MVIGVDASRAFGKERTGTENYSYHLITHMIRLPESSKDRFVLFVRANTTIPKEIAQSNVQIVEIKLPYLWTQVGLAMATWGRYGSGCQSVRASERQVVRALAGLDVLWIPAHTLPVFRRPDLKMVVTIHGLEYEWLPEYNNLLQRWYLPLSTIYAVRQATKLIAVSKFTKKQLIERLKAISKDIKVIHEGVIFSTSDYQNVSKFRVLNKWKLKDKQYILFVGTIQPRKNLAFLIEVFAQLPLSVRKQLKLVIAGNQGWMSEEVYAAPAKYGISSQVIFPGRVGDQELSILYDGAIVYAQPSITEGFGLPILEAMAHRIPVISSDGGALPEVVGEAGVVVPVSDQQKWVEGLTELLTNPRLRERLSAAGVWRLKNFSWDKAARETLDLLHQLS